MKLMMLGTGNASAVECYNTCFIIMDEQNCRRRWRIFGLIGNEVTFFDIGSAKTKQFGFCMKINPETASYVSHDQVLVFCGDEPCHQEGRPYVDHAD